MSLPRDVYWWIEDENGQLVQYGREILSGETRIWDGGAPNVGWYRRDVKSLCRKGERPVKVRMVRED